MNKPKTYTVDNVFNASMVGFDIFFKSKKHVNFLLEDISKIITTKVILSHDTNTPNNNYYPLLCIEYKSTSSKYILKIPKAYYPSMKNKLIQLMEYLTEYCEIDNFSYMKTYLSFNERELKTIRNIQNMDIFRYVLCFDEDYVNKFLPQRFVSPYNMSIKAMTPYKGVVISHNTMMSDKMFKIPNKEYYGVDLTDSVYSELRFNYIGGENWCHIPDNILKIIEYYIIFTYQQLNTITYTGAEMSIFNKLRNSFISISNALADPISFLGNNTSMKVFVNLNNNPQVIKTMWSKIYDNIFNLRFGNGINDGEFNYDSEIDRYQLRESTIKGGVLVGYDLIGCDIDKTILVDCRIYNSQIKNSRVVHSTGFEECKFYNSFIVDTDIEQECYIEDSTYVNKTHSVFYGDAKNSVIKYCDISHGCKIDNDSVILNMQSQQAMYKDDDTVDDMSYYHAII